MASLTVAAEGSVMHIMLDVTAAAVRGRVPMLFATRMTIRTRGRFVRPIQREVAEVMIEDFFAQHYVGTSAFMVGVANNALFRLRRLEKTVIPRQGFSVPANILVTSEAQ